MLQQNVAIQRVLGQNLLEQVAWRAETAECLANVSVGLEKRAFSRPLHPPLPLGGEHPKPRTAEGRAWATHTNLHQDQYITSVTHTNCPSRPATPGKPAHTVWANPGSSEAL